eukprot:gene28374-31508_t
MAKVGLIALLIVALAFEQALCHKFSCPLGHFKVDGKKICRKCPLGTYFPGAGAPDSCKSCLAGTYADDTGSNECKTCPEGTYSTRKADSCSPCTADAPVEQCPPKSVPLLDYLRSLKNVEYMTALLQTYGRDILDSSAPSTFSLLVPSDRAFQDVFFSMGITLAGALITDNAWSMRRIVKNHILSNFDILSVGEEEVKVPTSSYDDAYMTISQPTEGNYIFDQEAKSSLVSEDARYTIVILEDVLVPTVTPEMRITSYLNMRYFPPWYGPKGCFDPDAGLDCCLPGFVGLVNEGQAPCYPCKAGSFAREIGLSECQLCSGSSYSSASGAAFCTTRPGGTTANDSEGSTGCTECKAGSYGTSGSCRPCKTSSYSSTPGVDKCSDCPVGTIASSIGSTKCTVCAPGEYARPGGNTCSACSSGSYESGGVCEDSPARSIASNPLPLQLKWRLTSPHLFIRLARMGVVVSVRIVPPAPSHLVLEQLNVPNVKLDAMRLEADPAPRAPREPSVLKRAHPSAPIVLSAPLPQAQVRLSAPSVHLASTPVLGATRAVHVLQARMRAAVSVRIVPPAPSHLVLEQLNVPNVKLEAMRLEADPAPRAPREPSVLKRAHPSAPIVLSAPLPQAQVRLSAPSVHLASTPVLGATRAVHVLQARMGVVVSVRIVPPAPSHLVLEQLIVPNVKLEAMRLEADPAPRAPREPSVLKRAHPSAPIVLSAPLPQAQVQPSAPPVHLASTPVLGATPAVRVPQARMGVVVSVRIVPPAVSHLVLEQLNVRNVKLEAICLEADHATRAPGAPSVLKQAHPSALIVLSAPLPQAQVQPSAPPVHLASTPALGATPAARMGVVVYVRIVPPAPSHLVLEQLNVPNVKLEAICLEADPATRAPREPSVLKRAHPSAPIVLSAPLPQAQVQPSAPPVHLARMGVVVSVRIVPPAVSHLVLEQLNVRNVKLEAMRLEADPATRAPGAPSVLIQAHPRAPAVLLALRVIPALPHASSASALLALQVIPALPHGSRASTLLALQVIPALPNASRASTLLALQVIPALPHALSASPLLDNFSYVIFVGV